MESYDPEEKLPDSEPQSGRPSWLRLLRIVFVIVVVSLAVMAFGSWYFTNTFDFVFGPPR